MFTQCLLECKLNPEISVYEEYPDSICLLLFLQGSPEYDSTASDTCNYVFKWQTSYACPIGGSTSGETGSCAVKDPVSSYVFNLSPLARSRSFYRVTGAGKTFILNICGNVSGSECNKLTVGQAAGGCVYTATKDKNFVIGQVSKQLKYSIGQITLEYKYEIYIFLSFCFSVKLDTHFACFEIRLSLIFQYHFNGNHFCWNSQKNFSRRNLLKKLLVFVVY